MRDILHFLAVFLLAALPGASFPDPAWGAAPPGPDAGDYFNVRSFGAKGDGVSDDTEPIRRAILAASRPSIGSFRVGQGGVVFFPRGVYKVTDTLRIDSSGVGLLGEGLRTSAISLALGDAKKDGLRIGPVGQGGFIRGLAIYSEYSGAVRDIVSVERWSFLDIDELYIYGAGRFGIRLGQAMGHTIGLVRIEKSGRSGLWIGEGETGVESTTVRGTGLFVQDTLQGPGIDVGKCYGLTLAGSVIERTGVAERPEDAAGIRVSGPAEVTLTGTYFERNAGWDMDVGTQDRAHFVSVNPSIRTGGAKAKGYGVARIDRATGGGIFGGGIVDLAPGDRSVLLTDRAMNFTVLGVSIPAASPPEFARFGADGLARYKGIIATFDGSGDQQVLGSYRVRNTGGAYLGKADAPPASGKWTPGDAVFNSSPAPGRPAGWICTRGGEPGVWIPFGVIPLEPPENPMEAR